MSVHRRNIAVFTGLLVACLIGVAYWLSSNDSTTHAPGTSGKNADSPDGPTLEGHEANPAALTDAKTPKSGAVEAPAREPLLLHGRVVDARGQPVANAEVFALSALAVGVDEDELDDPGFARARSDAKGSWQTRIANTAGVRLVAFSESHLPGTVTLVGNERNDIEIVVGDPWRLTVRVEGPDGGWPAGTHLRVYTDAEDLWERTLDAKRQEFWYGDEFDEGRLDPVELAIPTRARVVVEVVPPPFHATIPPHIRLEEPRGDVAFRIVRSARIDVTVRQADGTPLPERTRISATLLSVDRGEAVTGLSRLGDTAPFATGLNPGRYRVEVRVEGHRPWTHEFEVLSADDRFEFEARMEALAAADRPGRVLLRIVEGDPAPAAVVALARSGATPGSQGTYQVFLRAAGSETWVDAWPGELPDGRVELRAELAAMQQAGAEQGTYDVLVAKRDTGTAAFVRGVRIFGDQTNEIDVRLEPGSVFRIADLVSSDAQYVGIEVRTAKGGALPLYAFFRWGSSSYSSEDNVRYLLRIPLQPIVLGPYPATSVEVHLQAADGKTSVHRVRGASTPRSDGVK